MGQEVRADAPAPLITISNLDAVWVLADVYEQDLALVGLLGIEHGERNGHHYVDGFAGEGASDTEGQRFLAAHPDLYEHGRGTVRVSIRDGRLRFASLDVPGYASAAEPDWSTLGTVASTFVTEPS